MRGGLAGFKPQELSNTVWAYATAGVAADALYAAGAEAAVRGGLAGFTPQNLANTVWAYATADHYHQALLADCSRVISDSLARDPSRWSVPPPAPIPCPLPPHTPSEPPPLLHNRNSDN